MFSWGFVKFDHGLFMYGSSYLGCDEFQEAHFNYVEQYAISCNIQDICEEHGVHCNYIIEWSQHCNLALDKLGEACIEALHFFV